MKRALTVLIVLVLLTVAGYFGFNYWQQRQATVSDVPPAAADPAATTAATTDTAAATVTTTDPAAAPAAATPGVYDLTAQADGMSKAVATLTMEKGDVIKFRFYPNEAPATAKRIAQLISEGFYNGITFHRVIAGFVAQAGDPTGTGGSGSGVKLKAEFNSRKHEPGIWSMARLPTDVDSADSQFFIMLGAAPSLDNQYTIFGKVVEGFENVQKIQIGEKIKTFTIQ